MTRRSSITVASVGREKRINAMSAGETFSPATNTNMLLENGMVIFYLSTSASIVMTFDAGRRIMFRVFVGNMATWKKVADWRLRMQFIEPRKKPLDCDLDFTERL